MRLTKTAFVVSTLAALGGCVAVPAAPGYYAPQAAYYGPAPAYYGPPAYHGPSIGIGVYGGYWGRRHWH